MDLFKNLLWDALINAAIKALFSLFPVLAWGPLGYIATWIIGHFTDALYNGMKDIFDLEQIVIRNTEARRVYDTASTKLKILARDKGIDSLEFKEARDANRKALSDLVRWTT